MARQKTAKKIEQELIELEKRYWQAIQDRDIEAALELTADPCIVAGAQGVIKLDKARFGAMMQAENYTLDHFEMGKDVQVELLSDDVAVVAYRVHEEVTLDGKPVTIEAADASTWVRRGGRWLCSLHTESLLGDPFGCDRTVSASA